MTDTSNSKPPDGVGPDFLVAGRYRLVSKIGGGGMGAVWLARDQMLARDVAVKQVISTESMSEDSAGQARERAMREGRIAARLTHKHAIAMHDVVLEQGEPWLVMEYLPSRSLAQVLQMTGTMSVKQSAHIGAQVADALAEAHAEGILHRDIKPANILIANSGRNTGLVKITDFGISRAKDDVQVTQTGIITGTPAYFSPEVARGDEPTEASDVYSLGSTIYTAIEGQPPFGTSENSLTLLHRVARAQITPPQRSREATKILLALLEPNPHNRPTMAQARDELAKVVSSNTGSSANQVLETPLATDGVPLWASRVSGPHGPISQPSSPGISPGPTPAPLRPQAWQQNSGPSHPQHGVPPLQYPGSTPISQPPSAQPPSAQPLSAMPQPGLSQPSGPSQPAYFTNSTPTQQPTSSVSANTLAAAILGMCTALAILAFVLIALT